MDTFVTLHVVGCGDDSGDVRDALDRAMQWFHRVERCCSRFDAASELTALTGRIGVPVVVSTMLFKAIEFAIAVAEESGGAFDPTVGIEMERRGFNRDHRTGRIVQTAAGSSERVSYRDVLVHSGTEAITLTRPLMLDLGAVAKGLAIDMAAEELAPFGNFAIDAGGDLYLAGMNPEGVPWSIGIRHPREHDRMLETLRVSDRAVCTSGDYERRAADGQGHVLDPRTGTPAGQVVSSTVVAPAAMLADALATAAFVLGPAEGIALLDRHGVGGLIVSSDLERHVTTKSLTG